MILPAYPQQGYPVTAQWGRTVVDAIKALQVRAGKGLRKVSEGPDGSVFESTAQSVQQAGSGLDLSKFAFGLTISGATVTVLAGDWPLGETEASLEATDVSISVDHQYVGLEIDPAACTIKVIGPSTNKSIFLPGGGKFRTWLHQFRYRPPSDPDGIGTATLERTHLGSLFIPGHFSK